MFTKYVTIIKKLVSPVSKEEETARREFIFHILLFAVIFLSCVAFLINTIDWMRGQISLSSSIVILPVILFFTGLYWISQKGYSFVAMVFFCSVFFLLNCYVTFVFGVDIPAALLTYALIIVITGILMGTRVALFSALLVILTVSVIGYLQIISVISVKGYWRLELMTISDLVFFAVIFLIVTAVSWLSNREIQKSLVRARKSEADLKIERDNLEITVEERTREIKEMQLEKMGHLYRFAEFGKLSSGLFHDLINPLTAISLNMELIKSNTLAGKQSEAHFNRALLATHKMESFIASVRKQISQQETRKVFSLHEEVRQIIEILSFKAMQSKVSLIFEDTSQIEFYGDNIKFSQIVLNLIGNAIDSYHEYREDQEKKVVVTLTQSDGVITFSVRDYGTGIPPEYIEKIFEPFFTTKDPKHGTGIGLSLVRGMVERDFAGTIIAQNALGAGSIFIVTIPQRFLS